MIPPKEKSKELYWNYYQNVSDTSFPEETAKKCALIAVDEILKLRCLSGGWQEHLKLQNDETQRPYWQEVKQELEKL